MMTDRRRKTPVMHTPRSGPTAPATHQAIIKWWFRIRVAGGFWMLNGGGFGMLIGGGVDVNTQADYKTSIGRFGKQSFAAA